MTGRPRKPTMTKVLQGTFRKDRQPEREPEYERPSNRVKPPVYLNKWAKEYWKDHVQELVDTGVMTDQDIPLYTMLSESYGEWRMYHEMVMHNPDGTDRTLDEYFNERNYFMSKMPEWISYNNSYDRYAKLCAKFGLSPSDRGKIDLGAKKEEEMSETEKQWREVNG